MIKKHKSFLNNRPTLGLLTSGGGDPVGHFVWSGVASIAKKHDVNLICFPGKPIGSTLGFEAQANVLYDLVDTEIIDGLIIWLAGTTFYVDLDEVKIFCNHYSALPVVTVGVHVEGVPGVTVDNYHGMRNVVSHIVDVHKRTRVAFIRGPVQHQEAEERYQAYRDVLQETGLPFDPNLVVTGDFKESGGKVALEELINQRNARFDALVAASDNMAIAAMKELQKRGIRIPEDVSIAGLNDESQSRFITPPLTTGPLHFYEQGSKAAEMVLDLMAGRPVPENVVLPAQLLVRQSCGCPDLLVLQANAGTGNISKKYDIELHRGSILNAVITSLELEPTQQNLNRVGQLFDALIQDVKGRSGSFLPLFSDVLRQSTYTDSQYSKWHTAISVLRNQVIQFLDEASVRNAENLFQQIRVMIGETSQRVQAFQRLQAEQKSQVLSDINQQLSATIDGQELLDILESALPQLDIRSCFISLYEDPASPTTLSRLVLAYNEHGSIKIDPSKITFPSRNLIPAIIPLGDRPRSLIVEPLYFRNDQLGFALFEADPQQEEVYEILRGQISGALKRTRLAEHNLELYNNAVQARQISEEGRQLAEQANSMKSRFLATVSHELRTPLTLIIGMIEMMLAEDVESLTTLPVSYRRDLKSIRTSSQHLSRLISDVLDLASSQAGELHLSCEPLSMETIFQEIMLLSEAIVREKGLTWRVELTPNLPMVWADRTRLKQIILNLVSNATKFTERGEVALIVTSTDKNVTIKVSDTGIGIPRDEQDKIFDEFRQSERTTQRGYGGMGLGLAITRRLVELHGGQIGVLSSGEEGGGSTFYFTLPAMDVLTFSGTDLDQRAKTVLLLSEQPGEGQKLCEYLTQRGYEVAELAIKNQPNWLSQIVVDPPGALIIDSQPANDRSWELIKLLKQNPATQSIPVVFYSLSEETDRGAVLELDYLTKPVNTSELVQAVTRQGLSGNFGSQHKTIMVVDDDPHILNLHTRVINSRLANFRVLKAHNGREALNMMQQEKPDLVLLDLMMPELDGFEVLETMRASDNLRNVPVIVLTAQILTIADMGRLQRGVTAVLSKGLFSNEEVLAQIESTLSRTKHLGNEARRMIRQAMAYIHEHYAEQITREQLAHYVGLSERHLNRCFSEETGMPVMTYLNRYRVRQAKTLLEKGEHSVSEVALAVGFTLTNYFGRIFREEVGVTPGAYLRGKRPGEVDE
jgi:signal transduction histidine kinase/DNA-binding LacI/PurR family transcriptional regulator/DNA-binding response OmpR family regulator